MEVQYGGAVWSAGSGSVEVQAEMVMASPEAWDRVMEGTGSWKGQGHGRDRVMLEWKGYIPHLIYI